jgi:AcrR family transcriptional regulator
MELLRAGDPDPTAKSVAQGAGVSLRLVFDHFADMDDLYQCVAALQLRRQWVDMPQLSPALSRSTRIERTVAHRGAPWRTVARSSRRIPKSGAPWVGRAPTSPSVRRALAAADTLFLEDLEATFAPELAGVTGSARGELVGAMDTGTSWEAWERLRKTSGIPVRGARRVMSLILESLCASTASARAALARHRGPRSQSEDSSAMRRRTSATRGAG